MTRLIMLDPMSSDRLDRIRPFVPEGWEVAAAPSRGAPDQEAALRGARFCITGDVPVTAAMMAVPGLKAVHKWGVGYDNIDLDAARAHGVRVLRTTGSNAVAVAETTLGLILALGRNVVRGHVGIARGEWRKGALAPSSSTLSGRTVGIVGMGYIGRALARLLRGFDCTIRYTKRTRLTAEEETSLGLTFDDFDDLMAEADVVTLNCELNDSTRNLIDWRALSLMKPSALLVNAARGGVVVEADLAEALREGRLAGAAVDVFGIEPVPSDNPLVGLDRVILTPHLGAISADSFTTNVMRMMANLEAIEDGRPPRNIDVLV